MSLLTQNLHLGLRIQLNRCSSLLFSDASNKITKCQYSQFVKSLPASNSASASSPSAAPSFLEIQSPVVVQSCGMKVKNALELRCKDCYFVYKSGVKHVLCPTHGRHKARNPIPKPKYILTASVRKAKKPW